MKITRQETEKMCDDVTIIQGLITLLSVTPL